MLPQLFLKKSFASIGVVFGLVVISGCGGAVPAPKTFVAFHSPSGRFSCDYPQGWETTSAGKPESPNAWAKFTSGHAEIRVEADLAGSLLGDMAKSTGSTFGVEEEPPVARIHPMGERQMKEDFTNYKEREPKSFQSKGIGEGRRSTFIADQTLGGKIYGYRATLLANDRRITVVCTCPATNWKTLKPAFETVVASIRQGGS
ncbi:hypothetical protein SAMN05444166_1348 [Singulisphaera sp. GP187]|uniref:hypothetical protein n=1 Tax=Singulisphaera sp. GP187 TaxID=1882752 RepID=UPI00092AAB25|nr:hypothetical protein [Singulisphaera sp. GP187]SIN86703.1 hypothetical protein SAMN05444166_1348 [Singulisphaera sp. GP187]